MKNLKKTLAVVLAFAMVLSMGFSAFAYTDVTAGTKVAEAVGILSNLNIFTGFEDGTFKPDDTVTRAQMAAIICRTLGYEDQATASTGTTNFNDVPASHWASGYINVAESLQIVNGYGNGAFGPEDQVTYEQAIKMIVVALGYELDAQAKGGWSTGYLAVAAREGITKNSNGVVGAPAARGTIAVLVYNSLEVRLMDQKSWTPSGQDDAYGKLDETILSQYLGIKKVEGIVESVPFNAYASGYKADDDAMITFDSEAVYFEYVDGKLEDDGLEIFSYDASLVPEANNFAGKKVVAYVGEEQDDETGNYMVYAIAEKQGANKVTTISAAQLVDASSPNAFTEAGVIAYNEVGSSKVTKLDLDDEVIVVGNFGTEVFSEEEVYVGEELVEDGKLTDTEELAEFVGEGVITLISNDANSKIDVIIATIYDGEAVVEEVTTDDGVVMFDLYNGTLEDIDTEDEDVLNVVIKDGVVATVADIAANDTVSYINVAGDDSFNVYYVSSKTVTGKVDFYDDETVEIGGTEYEVSVNSGLDIEEDLKGTEGIFFLNVDGQIAYADASAEKGNYAVIYSIGTTNRKTEIEVVLADGTAATYELNKDKVQLDGVKKTDADIVDYFDDLMTGTDAGWHVAEADEVTGLVFELIVKDGKVTKITPVDSEGSATSKEYDEENMSYGNLSFNEDTIVVSVADVEGNIDSSDIKVGKIADFFVDGEGAEFDLTAYDYNNNEIAGLVVGYNLTTTIPQDAAAFIISGKVKEKDVDGDTAYVLTGFQDGKKASYTLYNEEESFNEADFAMGNVLLLGVATADGMISDYEVIYDIEAGLAEDIANKEDEYYYFGALDTTPDNEETEENESKLPTASKFFLAEGATSVVKTGESANAYDAEEGVVMRNSARYTLVDFSESTTPTVSKKAKGTALFSRYDSKYDYEIVVRYFEDSQVEVIVYKYAQ